MGKKPSPGLIGYRCFSEKIPSRSGFVPDGREASGGNRGQGQRDQNIVAGKRKTEKPPGGLVATHNMNRFQLVEQRPLATEVAQGARAIGRAGPPKPLDAGVIGA